MSNLQDFFKTVFDEGDATCFTDVPQGTKVTPVSSLTNLTEYFCINALDPTCDNKPTQHYHDSSTPRRADANVVTCRTILIEMDKLPLEEQHKLITELKMPYSTQTFSGSKSYHYLIVLEDALDDIDEYKDLAARVFKALGGKDVVDCANKNPSRLSRLPTALRHSKATLLADGTRHIPYQDLLFVGPRIKNADLEAWLIANGAPRVEKQPPFDWDRWEAETGRCRPPLTMDYLPAYARNFLSFGAPDGEWNDSLFKTAAALHRCGVTEDDAIDKLKGVTGSLDAKDLRTIKSAFGA